MTTFGPQGIPAATRSPWIPAATRPGVDHSIELRTVPQLQPGSVCVFGAWLCVQPGPQLQPGPACISSAPNAKPSVVCRSLDGTPTRSAAATWPGVDRTANRSAAATWPPWIQRCASSPGPQGIPAANRPGVVTRWNSNPFRSCNPVPMDPSCNPSRSRSLDRTANRSAAATRLGLRVRWRFVA